MNTVLEKEQLVILSERNYRKIHHVSYDTVLGMENSFAQEGVSIYRLSPIMKKINSAFRKLKLKQVPDFTIRCNANKYYLFICMAMQDLEAQTATLKWLSHNTHRVLLYCFDTWEAQYEKWDQLFSIIKPAHIFFAYKHSKEYFQQRYDQVHFLPQSMDEDFFYPRTVQKERLFMQMGRKNEVIHKMILKYLQEHGLADADENYVYERTVGKIIYPDTNDLAENICRSFFFVCAPQALENSALTGKVSDVTARFYEAMACKCLIIGFKPDTYDELFPTNSMIELKPDGSDFEKRIEYFRDNPHGYQKLVEDNYLYILEHHRWKNRLESIITLLNA